MSNILPFPDRNKDVRIIARRIFESPFQRTHTDINRALAELNKLTKYDCNF